MNNLELFSFKIVELIYYLHSEYGDFVNDFIIKELNKIKDSVSKQTIVMTNEEKAYKFIKFKEELDKYKSKPRTCGCDLAGMPVKDEAIEESLQKFREELKEFNFNNEISLRNFYINGVNYINDLRKKCGDIVKSHISLLIYAMNKYVKDNIHDDFNYCNNIDKIDNIYNDLSNALDIIRSDIAKSQNYKRSEIGDSEI